jgi:hypothetical protein
MPAGAQPERSRAAPLERRPRAEPVLPAFAYGLLLLEAALLTWLYATHDVPPGDALGHAIGWGGTGSMAAMHVYSVRKRVRALANLGRLRSWLQLHIFLGLQGAMMVTFHSLHLTTLFNISGATLAMTLIVVASGAFGRYLYSWLPKSLTGERLDARGIEAELQRLQPIITAGVDAHPELAAAAAAVESRQELSGRLGLRGLIAEDRRTRRALAGLDRAIAAVKRGRPGPELLGYMAALQRRAALTRRLAGLTAAERMFRSWHLFHKPLTVVLLGSVILHIVAHYVYAARFSG